MFFAESVDACTSVAEVAQFVTMALALLCRFPWEVRGLIIELSWGDKCWLCEERKGLLCCIDNCDYEMRCLACFVGMLPDETHQRLVDGIQNGVHSHSACSPSAVSLSSQRSIATTD